MRPALLPSAAATWELPPGLAALLRALALCVGAGVVIGALTSLLNPFVGLGLVVSVGVVLAVATRPTGRFWLLAGVMCLLPFAAVPKLGIQPTLLDGTMALLLGVALLRVLLRLQRGVHTPLDLPVVIYVVLCTVAFINGSAFGVTAETIKYFIRVMFGILLYFAFTNGLTSRRALRSFTNAIILGAFGAALLADFFKLAGQGTAMRWLSALGPLGYPTGADTLRFIASTTIWRATSTSVDPNIFGGLLMVGIVLLVGRWLGALTEAGTEGDLAGGVVAAGPEQRRRERRRASWIALPLLAVMVWALLLSYSRGAYVGTGVGLLFLAVIRYRKLIPLVAFIALFAAFALGGTNFGRHLVSGFLVEDKAAAMRLGEYKDALTFISQYPVFGVGFGTTPTGTAIAPDVGVYVGVSNIYLLMTLEIGLVGMIGFAAVGITLLAWTFQGYSRAGPAAQTWIATAAATLFASAVAGIADHYFFRYPHMVALFWSVIGILAISLLLAAQEQASHEISSRDTRQEKAAV